MHRCTDVALANANIQFHFDNLESRPRLAVAAHPVAVAVSDVDNVPVASLVHFRMYNNYSSFIKRAEIRIFEQQQSLQTAPPEIIALADTGSVEWQPPTKPPASPARQLRSPPRH